MTNKETGKIEGIIFSDKELTLLKRQGDRKVVVIYNDKEKIISEKELQTTNNPFFNSKKPLPGMYYDFLIEFSVGCKA